MYKTLSRYMTITRPKKRSPLAGLIAATAALSLSMCGWASLAVAAQHTGHHAAPASAAQLHREHQRAVRAHDTANDPFDSSTSDALNLQQLAKALVLGNDPGVPDISATGAATGDLARSPVDNSVPASAKAAEPVTEGDATAATGDATPPAEDKTKLPGQ